MITKPFTMLRATCEDFLDRLREFDNIETECTELLAFLKIFKSSECLFLEELINDGNEDDMYVFMNQIYENGIRIDKFNITPFLPNEFFDYIYKRFQYMNDPYLYYMDECSVGEEYVTNKNQTLMFDLKDTTEKDNPKCLYEDIHNYVMFIDKKTSMRFASSNILQKDVLNKTIHYPHFKIRFKIKKSKFYKNGTKCIAKMEFYAPALGFCKRYRETIVVEIDKCGGMYETVLKKKCYNLFRNHVMQSITFQDVISADEYILSDLNDIGCNLNYHVYKKINRVKG